MNKRKTKKPSWKNSNRKVKLVAHFKAKKKQKPTASRFINMEQVEHKQKAPLSIPEEVMEHLTPNQLCLLEEMDQHEREYLIDEIKREFKIGD